MAKRPSKREKDKSQLQTALEFIKSVAHGNNPNDAYCRFHGGYVYYNNLVISAGHPIGIDYNACPDIDKILRAVDGMPTNTTITFDRDRIKIKYGHKEYTVPCIDGSGLPWAPILNPMLEADERLTDAMLKAAIPTKEGALTALEASILLRPYTALGTDRIIVVEAFHGVPLPHEMRVPAIFAQTLKKLKKTITHVGFSDVAFSVIFDDGSWLTTQLYVEDVGLSSDRILALLKDMNAAAIADNSFYEGVKEAFAYDKEAVINFRGDHLTLTRDGNVTFTYTFNKPVQIEDFSAAVSAMHKIVDIVEKVDVSNSQTLLSFTGDKLRGAIARRHDR